MKVSIAPHDKIYRDLYLETDTFCDGMEHDWRNKAGLNDAQKETASKLARGKWEIEIDDSGQAMLIVK